MVALYVTSPEPRSGKTMVCAGLGRHLQGKGQKTGYFKPVIADNTNSAMHNGDAVFMKQLLDLEEPVELLSPVFKDESSLNKGIKEAYTKVSKGKDIVIIEGMADQGQTSRHIAEALNAKIIIVQSMSQQISGEATSYQDWGKNLLGIVVNKVPGIKLENMSTEVSTAPDKSGVSILGVLPEDRTLLAMTVGELTERIQGEILAGAEKSAELVENFMLGAKCVDPGPVYFNRKANKAAVIESERTDMQIAALETSTRCLILSGNTAPRPLVLYRARERNVPVVFSRDDISTIVSNIEDALAENSFNQENKLPRLMEIMEQYFDFTQVYHGLGLSVS